MKPVLAFRPPDSASREYWSHAAPTSPPGGPRNPTIDHYRAPVQIPPGESSSAVFERVRGRLLAYDIFPRWLIGFTIVPQAPLQSGATIIQRILLGPLAFEAGVRVLEVWERREGEVRKAGFNYVTLEGHPECGVASFEVCLDESGAVTVHLGARSRPGLWLTQLARPVARAFQRAATRAALRRLVQP